MFPDVSFPYSCSCRIKLWWFSPVWLNLLRSSALTWCVRSLCVHVCCVEQRWTTTTPCSSTAHAARSRWLRKTKRDATASARRLSRRLLGRQTWRAARISCQACLLLMVTMRPSMGLGPTALTSLPREWGSDALYYFTLSVFFLSILLLLVAFCFSRSLFHRWNAQIRDLCDGEMREARDGPRRRGGAFDAFLDEICVRHIPSSRVWRLVTLV